MFYVNRQKIGKIQNPEVNPIFASLEMEDDIFMVKPCFQLFRQVIGVVNLVILLFIKKRPDASS
jgi:hypothetical protein